MKKILCIATVLFFVFTSAGFCAWEVTSNGGTPENGNGSIGSFKASKNVRIRVYSGSQSYAASAGHKSGDKAYGVASDSSVVRWTTKSKGNDWTTDPSASDGTAFSTWHSM